MPRRPPTPTLFPYTTLFRSVLITEPLDTSVATAETQLLRSLGREGDSVLVRRSCVSDRKSTRLNSSHTVISYAVFCLKKKKNIAMDSDTLIAAAVLMKGLHV